jgi:hypothetical protein
MAVPLVLDSPLLDDGGVQVELTAAEICTAVDCVIVVDIVVRVGSGKARMLMDEMLSTLPAR